MERKPLSWSMSTIGCYWYAVGCTGIVYGISSVREGSGPGYYQLVWRNGEQIGTRYAGLADAQQVAEQHDTVEYNLQQVRAKPVEQRTTIPLSPFCIPGRSGWFRKGYAAITRSSVAIYHLPPRAGDEAPIPVLVLENGPELRLMLARLLEEAARYG